MLRQKVRSSTIDEVGLDGQTLYVQFLSGGVYAYENAASEYAGLRDAASVGRHFHHYIRGKYRFHKLDCTEVNPFDLQGS